MNDRPVAVQLQRETPQRVPLAMSRAGLAMLVTFAAGTASADPDDGFAWRAPRECPDTSAVRERIDARLQGASLGAIQVHVEKVRGRFVATIDARAITVANAVRTLESPRCEALADAVALVVARLANEANQPRPPRAVDDDEEPPLASGLIAMPADRVERREPAGLIDRTSPWPAEPRTWGGGMHLLGLSGIGAQPRIGIGGEVAAYVRRHDVVTQVAFAHWAPRTVSPADGAPTGLAVTLSTFALRMGWGPERMPVRAWGLVEVGTLRGEGVGSVDERMGSSRWVAVGAGLGVGWPIARLVRLTGTFELAAPLGQVRFVAGGTEVYRPNAAVARTALGLEVGWR